MEEIVRGFNAIIEKGQAFYWGTSEWSPAEIEEAIGVAQRLNLIGPTCDQPHYSMLHRDNVERDLAGVAAKYGYGTTVWSPLESGLLTGKYNDGVSLANALRAHSSRNSVLTSPVDPNRLPFHYQRQCLLRHHQRAPDSRWTS